MDVGFVSEPWEREEKQPNYKIKLEDHDIVSKSTKERGRRAALQSLQTIKKIILKNITYTLLNIKLDVEVVWCLLIANNTQQNSKIQNIAHASAYGKPSSKNKT